MTTTHTAKQCILRGATQSETGGTSLLKSLLRDLRNSERYQKAMEAFKNRGEIDTVVGHSLGGSVSLEMQANFKDRVTKRRTYGAPVFNLLGSDSETSERYRHWLDPFSVLDRSGTKTEKRNPFDSVSLTHDYNDLGGDKLSTEQIPIEEDDED